MKNREEIANDMYFDFIKKSKVDVPQNIEDIALNKINLHKKSVYNNKLRIWSSSFAAAAIVVLAFLFIIPQTNHSKLYSSNLTSTQKKEQFENALKIINESLSVQKPKPKTLYNDENFEIILGK